MLNLRKIDLNLLVVFEAIFAARNISRAATTLGLTQPTISNALARLRETVGDQLFVRSGNGVEPTPRAIQLIGPVRTALSQLEKGLDVSMDFDPLSISRHFKLVILDPAEPIIMPPILRAVAQHKTITFEILPIMGTPLKDRLSDDSIDLVVAPFIQAADELCCEAIGLVNLVSIARRDHPKISKSLPLDLFMSLCHVGLPSQLRSLSPIDEELKHLGLRRHIAYSVSKFWSFPSIVASTDLIAVLPLQFAKHAAEYYDIEIYPLPFELPEQKIYMTWKASRDSDPGLKWLRNQISKASMASNTGISAS